MGAAVQAGNGNNFEQFSAYGFTPRQMPMGQKFRPSAYFEEAEDANFSAPVIFTYQKATDTYKSEEFKINVPWPLNQGVFNDAITTYKEFTVPSIETQATQNSIKGRDTKNITPYNYWITSKVGEERDEYFSDFQVAELFSVRLVFGGFSSHFGPPSRPWAARMAWRRSPIYGV